MPMVASLQLDPAGSSGTPPRMTGRDGAYRRAVKRLQAA